MRIIVSAIVAVGAFTAAATCEAKEKRAEDHPQPEVVRQLVECRHVTASADRLACYDREVTAFVVATDKHDIVVADRKDLQEARRGLFGFAAPIGRLLGFGAAEDQTPDIKRIDTKVASVGHIQDGWRLVFEEGGTWEQVDLKNFVMSPKVGQKAAITKGAFGSYFVSVNGQPGIKMRRVQ